MKLRNLTAKGFMPLRDLSLDFEDLVYLIVGENGSGKSSLLESILWCLFGRSRAGRTEQLFNADSTSMSVAIRFEHGGSDYHVRRSCESRKSGTKLELTQLQGSTWVDIAEGSVRGTEKILQDRLGLNYDSFLVTSFFQQDNARTFLDSTSSERKEILRKLLGLGVYDRYCAEAKKRTVPIEADLKARQSKLEWICQQLNSILFDDLVAEKEMVLAEYESAQKHLTELEVTLRQYQSVDDLKAQLEKEKATGARAMKVIESGLAQLNQMDSEEKVLKATLAESAETVRVCDQVLAESRPEVELYQGKYDVICEYAPSIESDLRLARSNLERLRKNRDEIKSSPSCPMCLSDLSTEASKAVAIDRLKAEAEPLKSQIAELEEKVKTNNADKIEHGRYLTEITNRVRVAEDDKRKCESRINIAETKLDSFRTLRASLIESGKQPQQDYRDASVAQTRLERELERISLPPQTLLDETDESKAKLKSLQDRSNSIEAKLLDHDRLTTQKSQMEQALKPIQDQLQHHRYCTRMFDKDGIPLLLIKDALKSLQNDATELIRELDDQIDTIELVSEDTTLDIMVTDHRGRREYCMFSGGEKVRINFAIRLALSRYRSRQSCSAIESLVIDEGFGSLDEKGLNAFVDTIPKLKKWFSQVLIVSHIEGMKTLPFRTLEFVNEETEGTVVR